MRQEIKKEISIPEGVQVEVTGTLVKVTGPKGSLERDFAIPNVTVTSADGQIVVSSPRGTKREKTRIGTNTAHLRNMVKGVVKPFEYTLKICSGHFPMNTNLSGREFTVKNFLGEKIPRKVMLPEGADIKVDGDKITISSSDIELAGRAAAQLEQLTRVTNKDRRIFQDGIYITSKHGKDIK